MLFKKLITQQFLVTLGMTFPSMYYLTKMIQNRFLESEFTTVNDVQINFKDIRTAADFWFVSAAYSIILQDNTRINF